MTEGQKEDSQGQLGPGLVGTHSDSLFPSSPHPGPEAKNKEVVRGAVGWGAQDSPHFHLHCRWISPSLRHTCEAKGQPGVWQNPATDPSVLGLKVSAKAEEAGLAVQTPKLHWSRCSPAQQPGPDKSAEAKPQPNPKKQTRENRHKK